MIINGVNRQFYLGVYAAMKIAEQCPARDIARLGEMFTGAVTSDVMGIIATAAVAMNENHLMVLDSKAEPLKRAEVMKMSLNEWAKLAEEVTEAYRNGMQTSVEAESAKSEKNA